MLNKLGTTENMIEYHDNGNKSYEFITDSDGDITERTFDKNGNALTVKKALYQLFSYELTRDEQGNELAYKNTDGIYTIKGKQVTQQEYEAFIQELEKPKTAMQELIDYMKTYFHLTDESLEMFDKALEKEKQQTLLGVYEGQKNHSASDEENKIMAEHWFNETFKQNK